MTGGYVTARMAQLDRNLRLVHLLAHSSEGLTLDQMAADLAVSPRTAERLRDVAGLHFDLKEELDNRYRRFLFRDSQRRVYSRPTAAGIVALQAEVDAPTIAGQAARAVPLASLLAKDKAALDDREKRHLDPDLEALARLQRTLVPAGPSATTAPDTLAVVQGAILAGCCLEFDYRAEDSVAPKWRRVVPYWLVHGAVTYLVGKMPARDTAPVYYRLDRMRNARASDKTGCAPDDWDLDHWMAQSFGIWREDDHDVVLRVLPSGVERELAWRFHLTQAVAEDGDTFVVQFRAGGLREIAEHVFGWGGDVVIEAPKALLRVMRERLAAGREALTFHNEMNEHNDEPHPETIA